MTRRCSTLDINCRCSRFLHKLNAGHKVKFYYKEMPTVNLLKAPQVSILSGPASAALERSSKRQRTELRASEALDLNTLLSAISPESAFPSITWDFDDHVTTVTESDYDSSSDSSACSESSRKRLQSGMLRSKSIKHDLAELDSSRPLL
jgi:hypothetical protein